jgi:hypothetical protein
VCSVAKMSNSEAINIAEGYVNAESEEQFIAAWQQLIDTGLAWSLQGWFGRQASRMIEDGTCHESR